MIQKDKRLLALVGMFVIVVMALAAVGPVLAQSGAGQDGQGGPAAIEDDDTLGVLVTRHVTSASDLRQFFRSNSALRFDEGQTVTFPADVTVNIPVDRQGANGSQGQGTGATGGDAGATVQVTPPADAAGGAAGGTSGGSTSGDAGATAQVTPTADAAGGTTGDAGATGGTTGADAQATPTVAAGAETPVDLLGGDFEAGQTYVTQDGDTLGLLLGWMGFTATGSTDSTGVIGGTGTTGGAAADGAGGTAGGTTGSTTGGDAGMTAQTTPTADAAGGTTGGTTGGDAGTTAQTAPTADAAGGAGSGTTGGDAGTTTGGNTGAAGAEVTDEQLRAFLVLNQDLALEDGQMVNNQSGNPQTGAGAGAGNGTSMETAPTAQTGSGLIITDPTETVDDDGATAQVTPTADVAGGTSGGTTGGTTGETTVQATPTADAAGGTSGGTTGGTTVQVTPTQDAAGGTAGGTTGGATGGTSGGTTGGATTGESGGIVPQTGQAGQGVTTNQTGGTAAFGCVEPPNAPAGWGWYRLQGGESVGSVANRFGVEASQIIQNGSLVLIPGVEGAGLWQNHLLSCNPNQDTGENRGGENAVSGTAGIPVTGAGGPAFVGCREPGDAPKGWGWYRLQGGESVGSVANRFGVEASQIIQRGSLVMIPGVEGIGLWQNANLNCPNTNADQGNGENASQ